MERMLCCVQMLQVAAVNSFVKSRGEMYHVAHATLTICVTSTTRQSGLSVTSNRLARSLLTSLPRVRQPNVGRSLETSSRAVLDLSGHAMPWLLLMDKDALWSGARVPP